MLDETAHQSMLAAVDVAVSRCIDAYNMASEAGEADLAEAARARVNDLKSFRRTIVDRPTKKGRWMYARTPRGDARSR